MKILGPDGQPWARVLTAADVKPLRRSMGFVSKPLRDVPQETIQAVAPVVNAYSNYWPGWWW